MLNTLEIVAKFSFQKVKMQTPHTTTSYISAVRGANF